MKAILVIDVPQEDIGKLASIMYLGHDKYLRSIKFIPIQPMPMKRISTVDWLHTETQTQSATSIGKYPSDYTQIKTYEPSEYDKGWNDCLDMLEDLYD